MYVSYVSLKLHKCLLVGSPKVLRLQQFSSCAVLNRGPVYGNIPIIPPPFKVPESVLSARANNSNVFRLVEAYRTHGHLLSDVNPLRLPISRDTVAELQPGRYRLTDGGMQCSAAVLAGGAQDNDLSLQELIDVLEQSYCGQISAEFMHLPNEGEREWFAAAMEGNSLHQPLDTQQKINVCRLLLSSQAWDQFLANKFPSLKRYGGEGAESIVPFFEYTFRALAQSGVQHAVVGMAHRGRLNLLQDILRLPPHLLFQKMKGRPEFNEQFDFTGDALSHLTSNPVLEFDGSRLTVEVLANPSHLEAINPVTMGRTRALHRLQQTGHYGALCSETFCPTALPALDKNAPVCLQVHGDAAVRGQGVVQESLSLASVPNFCTGGSLHMVVNNQIGFTTEITEYPSDVALMARLPVIRVNGDKPESVVRAAELAVQYRHQFGRDVFVDLVCWRRHGHNELDNPRLTNPTMYSIIDAKKSVPDSYAASLVSEGVLTEEQVVAMQGEYVTRLATAYENASPPKASATLTQWRGLQQCPASTVEVWDTGVATDTLHFAAAKSVHTPESFNLHPHIAKMHVGGRLAKLAKHNALDWATAEAMAFGSLLLQGVGVRLCGQDVGRGTFAQRHCALVDQQTEQRFLPLNTLKPDQTAYLEVANSILSEEAVLGFEYGMSINCPDTLHIWEGQFGDFFNGAQIMFDTFLSSGESKWLYQSGLVVLLPHGYDGAGPEHSSCRVERFLSGCASSEDKADGSNVNWAVAAPTTPAQYFHLLRQQMVRPYRKPLIVVAPKTMLRLPAATSDVTDMAPGTHFLPLIDDPSAPEPAKVRRVVLVAGKHYYSLAAERAKRGVTDMAIVRLESLCPFPAHQLNAVIKKYSNANKLVWSQEEPRNMGAWPFLFPRFLNICGAKVSYAGRPPMAAPAVGIAERHAAEVTDILEQTFRS